MTYVLHPLSPIYFITGVIDRCPNAGISSKASRSLPYVKQWASIYLQDAHARLAPQLHGYDLSIEDIYTLQQLCAYEVSLTSLIEKFFDCRSILIPRLLPLGIPNSVSCSRRTNGRASTICM